MRQSRTASPPTIRLATPGDAGPLLAIYAPAVRETAISFELEPPAETEFRRRVADVVQSKPWLVCILEDRIVGYAYATAFRARPAYQWSVETSAYVHADHRRRRVGKGLYTSLLGVLRLQGFRQAYAGITLPNPASIALHQSVGFTPVGVFRSAGYKLGAWHDVGWWQLALQGDRSDPPPLPRSLDLIRGSSQWDQAMEHGVSVLTR